MLMQHVDRKRSRRESEYFGLYDEHTTSRFDYLRIDGES